MKTIDKLVRLGMVVAGAASLLSLTPLHAAVSVPSAQRYPSDQPDAQLIVSCDPVPIRRDYRAETASGVPLTDSYAVARGADHGLVRLMDQGGRRIKRYVVPHGLIRAIVKMKYDGIDGDRADLLFTSTGLRLVHTYATNAGVFTVSDVYQLAEPRRDGLEPAPLKSDDQMLTMLRTALKFARAYAPQCGLDAPR